MNEIEKYISEKNYDEAIQECIRNNLNNLGLLLTYITNPQSHYIIRQFQTNIESIKTDGKIIEEVVENNKHNDNTNLLSDEDEIDYKNIIRVKLLCNWTTSEHLRNEWDKMSQGNYTWNNIKIVLDNDPDYFVVINAPPIDVNPEPSKTIIFRMEPFMDKNNNLWGEWSSPDPNKFLKVCYHETDYNNNEWHISKTYNQLKTDVVIKNKEFDGIISTVLSAKYYDTGHIMRIDFIKYLETKNLPVHVFGDNKWEYVNYKGSLPSFQKDNAMFPYKYVFNVENNSIKNYYTEKLIDGILAECLVFYSGCYNVKEYIDERAFVYLELSNFDDDYTKIKNAIDNNLWEERLPYIKEAKKKILDYLQFFPRLERIINKTEDQKYIENTINL